MSYVTCICLCLFFFFQAEDGIRDLTVTGVQTCALPISITPKDPTLHLYYGDLYRLQSQRARGAADKDDFARKALEHYERSADLDPAFPDPFRQLGFLYYQQKETDRAREAFRKYLALKPDAPDAKRIREYLVELER